MSAIPNPYTSTKNDLILAIINHLGNNSNLQPRDIPNVYNDTTNDLLLCVLSKLVENTGNEWKLGGNTIGTDSNKLGTLDDKDLEIIRGNLQYLVFEKDETAGYLKKVVRLGGSILLTDKGDIWFKTPGVNDTIFQSIWDVVGQRSLMKLGSGFNPNTGEPDILNLEAEIYLPLQPNLSSLGTDADGKIIAGSGGGGGSVGITPIITLDTAAGTGATASIIGDDVCGVITINAGNSTTVGSIVILSSNAPGYDYNNAVISFTAVNSRGTICKDFSFELNGTGEFVITSHIALQDTATHIFSYQISKYS